MLNPQKYLPVPEPESVDEQIVSELLRFGPSTGAELLAAVGYPAATVIDRAIALHVAGVIRVVTVGGERRFTARGRTQ